MASKKTLLIDGDIILYRLGQALEREVEWTNDVWVMSTSLAEYKEAVVHQVEGFKETLDADKVVFALSDSRNFRKELVDPTYKENRTGKRKPMGFAKVRAWAEELERPWVSKVLPTLEADDVIGILATQPGTEAARVVVSDDKDFLGVPCDFYRIGLEERAPERFRPSLDEANSFWLEQTLTGDPADGYAGCPGVGPVGAARILDEADDPWSAVVSAYEKAKLTEQDAITQARLARILRWEDYDIEKGEVRLWTPTN